MEKFPKLFLLAAVSYLLLGVLLGLGLSAELVEAATIRFVHIHLNLLGFMAMFIYGVAYHILPRFNAIPLKRPGLVGVHFFLVNIGLIGMALFALFGGLYGSGALKAGFIISSVLEASGIALFAFNIMPVLLNETKIEAAKPAEKPKVEKSMKVAEVLKRWPQLIDVFVSSGFKALANPAARATFAKVITIEQACKVHRVNKDEFILKLNEALEKGVSAPATPEKVVSTTPQKKAEEAMTKGKKIERGEKAELETLVGSLIEVYPETKPVFEKHYGSGCFSCPGQAFETISQTAMMHGIKAETILDEINQAIESALPEIKVS